MVDFHVIYSNQAENYELLVSREDYQSNLLPALEDIYPLQGIQVLDLGTGTGRFACMLAPLTSHVLALDASDHMLKVAQERLETSNSLNHHLAVSDLRELPLAGEVADLSIAGWSLGHSIEWYGEGWRQEIYRAIIEIKRVMRPGGVIIIIETMGTGRETPQPPTPGLAAYYDLLEGVFGFSYRWIRTDYRFKSVEEAERLTHFFFGSELSERVVRNKLVIVPECTGIWWLRV